MVSILISNIKFKTNGGYEAKISSIDIFDDDCFCGLVNTPSAGEINARWNKSGLKRDGNFAINFDRVLNDYQDLKDLVSLYEKLKS